MRDTTRTSYSDKWFMGLLFIGLGVLFLARNLGYVEIHEVWRFWPFLIVALGVQKLFTATDRDRIGGGVWLVFIGLWLYVSLNEIWGLGFHESWPVLIIAWGVSVIAKAFTPARVIEHKES